MDRRSLLLIVITLMVFSYSCKSTKEILPGYNLYDAPNGSDKPGRVYRLDNENNTDFLVEYLQISPQASTIIIKEREQSKNLDVKSVFNFLSNGQEIIDTHASANINRRSNFKFKLGDAQVYKISDSDLRSIFPDLKDRLLADIKLFGHKDPKYFIVREAVTAKEIIITMDKGTYGNAEIKANLNQLVELNPTLIWNTSTKDEIKVSLKEGLFVFYKPERIVLSGGISGAIISVEPMDKPSLQSIALTE